MGFKIRFANSTSRVAEFDRNFYQLPIAPFSTGSMKDLLDDFCALRYNGVARIEEIRSFPAC